MGGSIIGGSTVYIYIYIAIDIGTMYSYIFSFLVSIL